MFTMIAALAIGSSTETRGITFEVWPADSLMKVLPTTKPPTSPEKFVYIDAVRNEYESGQIVVTALKKIEKLTVKVGEVIGPDGAKPRISVNFVGFVDIKRGTKDTPDEHLVAKAPAEMPDPLLEVRSISVEAGRNQPIWLTVYVPKTAKPGEYTANVEINADGITQAILTRIRVHSITLPDERNLFLTNWFNTGNIASAHGLQIWSEAYWEMLEAYASIMASHRQNVVITPIMELINGRDDGKGNLTFDFSRFDRWVEIFKKTGVIGYIEGGHLGSRSEWEAPDFDASWPSIFMPDGSLRTNPSVKVTSEEYKRFLSFFLPALQRHLEEKDLLEVYFQHLCDEPISTNAVSYKKLASYVREYAPKLKIIEACMCNELVGALDIWVPQPPHYERDIEFFRERQKAGDQVWFYTCLSPTGKYMNRFIDYPLIDVRLLHWVNFKYGLTGYLHWGLNYWVNEDPFGQLEPDWDGGNYLPPGDSHIIYPGNRGPISSIRFEALRDGVEDFELLRLLEKKDAKKARAIVDSVVRSLTDYVMDPAEFRKARAMIVKYLEE
jgi:hypothetical protein